MTKEMFDDVSVALRDNSYDFIEKGLKAILSDDEQEYKYAILHLYSGILLFLKDILYKEHWILLFQDVNEADKSKLFDGTIKSVNHHSLISRLKMTDALNISEKFDDDLDWLRQQRNKIEHLHSKLNPHEVRSRIASTLINLLTLINDHKTSLGFIYDEYYGDQYTYMDLLELIQRYSFEFEEFITKRNAIISSQVKQGELILECAQCNQNTMDIDSDSNQVLCYFCLLKLDIETFLTLFVPEYFEVVTEGYNNYNCPGCHSYLFFDYRGKMFCFECCSLYSMSSLMDCVRCGITHEVANDEFPVICDSCLTKLMNQD